MGHSDRRSAEAGRARPRLGRRLEMGLWIVGLSCLAWTGWALADAHLYQRSAIQQLQTSAPAAPIPGGEPVPEGEPAVEVAAGTPLATLRIPRLELSAVVAEGTASRVLRRAVGRLASGARIGENDNVVLAAHRDSYFRDLGQLEVGDRITLDHGEVVETYAVEWVRVVEPDQIDVAGSTGYPALTLVTCYPFWYVGNAPERYIVRAVKTTV